MDINQRINSIITELYNGNKRAFSQAIGVTPTVVENIVGSRQSKPSYGLLKKICSIENISTEWVISGTGDMIGSSSDKTPSSEIQLKTETKPRIPFDAVAGSLSVALGSVTNADCEQIPIIPTFPRYDFTIIARGRSMEPQYLSGDELACRFITETSFIQWGRAHVLDTSQGIVVKRIYDNGDSILCKSDNPGFPDFSVLKTEIYHIALVVGYIRIE